ncbi:hypothetical protein [Dokdonella sp.]|uniref:hypothetical protein n=1 Tax=Dokdonella sp. TaxID=2291710 RepID=UPI0025C40A77|nr:hypothetical protein [Dokdonella sp.]
MRCTPVIDALAIDVLHGQPGTAVGPHAPIDQVRDLRMLQARQNLPLTHEAPGQIGRQHTVAHALERDGLRKCAVGTLGEPHFTHATATKAAQQAERPDLQWRALFLLRNEVGLIGVQNQCPYFVRQRRICPRELRQRRIAL